MYQTTVGDPEQFEGTAIVAFLDLLGFSADVKRYWFDRDRSPLIKLMEIKKKTTFRNFGGYGGFNLDSKLHKARVHTISDSVMLCYALPDNCSGDDFGAAFYAICAQVAIVWSNAVDMGYTIRGGIEIGPIYWTPTETIGPALVDAYLLESKVARWSRVICGPSLLTQMLESELAMSFSTWGLFDASADGMIEVNHFELYDQNERDIEETEAFIKSLERMRALAGPHHSDKYDPILSKLRRESKLLFASKPRIESSISQLRLQSFFQ